MDKAELGRFTRALKTVDLKSDDIADLTSDIVAYLHAAYVTRHQRNQTATHELNQAMDALASLINTSYELQGTIGKVVERPANMQIYIVLFHGRKDPNQNLDDWGTDGPILGPFGYAHETYQSDIKVNYEVDGRETDGWLYLVDDLLYYDGVYYGDWSFTTFGRIEESDRVVTFDQAKADRLKDGAAPKTATSTIKTTQDLRNYLVSVPGTMLSDLAKYVEDVVDSERLAGREISADTYADAIHSYGAGRPAQHRAHRSQTVKELERETT